LVTDRLKEAEGLSAPVYWAQLSEWRGEKGNRVVSERIRSSDREKTPGKKKKLEKSGCRIYILRKTGNKFKKSVDKGEEKRRERPGERKKRGRVYIEHE